MLYIIGGLKIRPVEAGEIEDGSDSELSCYVACYIALLFSSQESSDEVITCYVAVSFVTLLYNTLSTPW